MALVTPLTGEIARMDWAGHRPSVAGFLSNRRRDGTVEQPDEINEATQVGQRLPSRPRHLPGLLRRVRQHVPPLDDAFPEMLQWPADVSAQSPDLLLDVTPPWPQGPSVRGRFGEPETLVLADHDEIQKGLAGALHKKGT
jgi:hypothetical protein